MVVRRWKEKEKTEKKEIVIKKIEIEVDFFDGFTPPERFEEPSWRNGHTSRCKECPFFMWIDDVDEGWCVIPPVSGENGECQIKKHFN